MMSKEAIPDEVISSSTTRNQVLTQHMVEGSDPKPVKMQEMFEQGSSSSNTIDEMMQLIVEPTESPQSQPEQNTSPEKDDERPLKRKLSALDHDQQDRGKGLQLMPQEPRPEEYYSWLTLTDPTTNELVSLVQNCNRPVPVSGPATNPPLIINEEAPEPNPLMTVGGAVVAGEDTLQANPSQLDDRFWADIIGDLVEDKKEKDEGSPKYRFPMYDELGVAVLPFLPK